MNSRLRNILGVACIAIASHADADVTVYERDGLAGHSFSSESRCGNFERFGFNNRASSVIVTSERWEVCEDRRLRGRCMVLRPGH